MGLWFWINESKIRAKQFAKFPPKYSALHAPSPSSGFVRYVFTKSICLFVFGIGFLCGPARYTNDHCHSDGYDAARFVCNPSSTPHLSLFREVLVGYD